MESTNEHSEGGGVVGESLADDERCGVDSAEVKLFFVRSPVVTESVLVADVVDKRLVEVKVKYTVVVKVVCLNTVRGYFVGWELAAGAVFEVVIVPRRVDLAGGRAEVSSLLDFVEGAFVTVEPLLTCEVCANVSVWYVSV